jgi:type IV secretory pathway VirB3-like protein
VDLSALIFVALAVAWAVYLIPKALKHHEDDLRSRTVDRFSSSMRVLARREPVDSRTARLVVPGQPAAEAVPVAPDVPTPSPVVQRAGAARAARRRRRVLGGLLLACVAVGALAAFAIVPAPSVAVPLVLLAAWLVACRLMVTAERAARTTTARRSATRGEQAPVAEDGPVTEEIAAVPASAAPAPAPGSWDPVPVTLPTYVSKEAAARRSVRTIDLDSTGVWTSGHDESDSRLAREADEAEKAAAPLSEAEAARRATGS